MAEHLRAYECGVKETTWSRTIHATSPGKAKREYFRDVRESWPDVKYTQLTCRVAGPPQTSDAFRRIATYRDLPFAKVGMAIEVEGHRGVIVGANDSSNFDVLFTDGPHAGTKGNSHPHWMTKYFGENGEVLADYTKRWPEARP